MIIIKLIEWVRDYYEQRNALLKNINKIEEKDDFLFIEFTDKKVTVLVERDITDFDLVLDKLKGKCDKTIPMIVTYNSKENVDALTRFWKRAVEFHERLSIMFANPDAIGDKRWIIFPFTHARISEPDALKTGLKAMSDAVEKIDIEHKDEFKGSNETV